MRTPPHDRQGESAVVFIWGSDRVTVPLREIGVRACKACRADRPARLLLRYDYAHAFFAFGMVLRRRYLHGCAACGTTRPVAPEGLPEARAAGRGAIPFLRRWGWAILLAAAAVAFVVAMEVLEANYQRRRQGR